MNFNDISIQLFTALLLNANAFGWRCRGILSDQPIRFAFLTNDDCCTGETMLAVVFCSFHYCSSHELLLVQARFTNEKEEAVLSQIDKNSIVWRIKKMDSFNIDKLKSLLSQRQQEKTDTKLARALTQRSPANLQGSAKQSNISQRWNQQIGKKSRWRMRRCKC